MQDAFADPLIGSSLYFYFSTSFCISWKTKHPPPKRNKKKEKKKEPENKTTPKAHGFFSPFLAGIITTKDVSNYMPL